MTTRSLGDAAMGLLAAIDRASHLAADADLQAVVAAAARAVHAAVGAGERSSCAAASARWRSTGCRSDQQGGRGEVSAGSDDGKIWRR